MTTCAGSHERRCWWHRGCTHRHACCSLTMSVSRWSSNRATSEPKPKPGFGKDCILRSRDHKLHIDIRHDIQISSTNFESYGHDYCYHGHEYCCMMPGLGTQLRKRAGISISEFHDALCGLGLRQDGHSRGRNTIRLGMILCIH